MQVLFQTTFPYMVHPPTKFFEKAGIESISRYVAPYLFSPELGIRLWQTAIAAIMAIPETSLHAHRNAPRHENDFGCAEKIFTVKPEPLSGGMKGLADTHLGRRALGFDRRHDGGPGGNGSVVDHLGNIRIKGTSRQ